MDITSENLPGPFLVKSLANIVVMALSHIRNLGIDGARPAQRGIFFQLLNGSREQFLGEGFGSLTLGWCLDAPEA